VCAVCCRECCVLCCGGYVKQNPPVMGECRVGISAVFSVDCQWIIFTRNWCKSVVVRKVLVPFVLVFMPFVAVQNNSENAVKGFQILSLRLP